jgi:hypothetical protein
VCALASGKAMSVAVIVNTRNIAIVVAVVLFLEIVIFSLFSFILFHSFLIQQECNLCYAMTALISFVEQEWIKQQNFVRTILNKKLILYHKCVEQTFSYMS